MIGKWGSESPYSRREVTKIDIIFYNYVFIILERDVTDHLKKIDI